MVNVSDLNIHSNVSVLVPPKEVKLVLPADERLIMQVADSRKTIENILIGEDKRMLAIVGPCSIHDKAGALDYAEVLAQLADRVSDRIFVVMRAFFAKPRTTVGWKGLFYDPAMDDSYDVNRGARLIREIVLGILSQGLPVATEVLDPYMVQYIDDLVSWSAIGARTSESQPHREMASGLSMPVGIKSGTDGAIRGAVDAIEAANHPHHFWGMDVNGRVAYIPSKGNRFAHLVLRGGHGGPNHDSESVAATLSTLADRHLMNSIVVDCSHGNSRKDFKRQSSVLNEILNQRISGNNHIVGFMLESNLVEGRQDILPVHLRHTMIHGQSVTDSCISFSETKKILLDAAHKFGH